jgi:SNF family Na+-dependent transporter
MGFTTLPVVFSSMPAGNLFGALWFFMLFLAAITSSLSMLQPAKAFFQEALGLTHKAATALVAALALGGNVFVLYFSKGLTALDTIDFWVGSFLIFVVAMVQIICFAWVFGVDKGLEIAHEGASIRIPGVFRFIMKYVSPTFLLVIFVGFCWNNVPKYVHAVIGGDGQEPDMMAILAWGLILATAALLVAITVIGSARWKAKELEAMEEQV